LRYYQAAVILLVVFAVLSAVQAAVALVDIATIPEDLQIVWRGIQYVFLTSWIAPLFVFIRNIYGYAENWLGAEDRTRFKYEANQLLGTWAKYEQYIKMLTVLIIALTIDTPVQPYAPYVAGGLAFLVDIVRKSLTDIAESKA